MITVYYEIYENDYFRNEYTETFSSLDEVADWIFGKMRQDYTQERKWLFFPTPDVIQSIPNKEYPWKIEFRPYFESPDYWIHMMKDDGKIILSDGTMTGGKKHRSKGFLEWCERCEERRKSPKFDFAD